MEWDDDDDEATLRMVLAVPEGGVGKLGGASAGRRCERMQRASEMGG